MMPISCTLGHHLHGERNVVRQRGDDVMLIDHFHRFVGLNVGAGDHALGVLLDPQHLGGIAVVLHHQRLDVQHHVRHVLDHARQGGEFMLSAVDFDLSDGTAL
jgi:hypothetical protein